MMDDKQLLNFLLNKLLYICSDELYCLAGLLDLDYSIEEDKGQTKSCCEGCDLYKICYKQEEVSIEAFANKLIIMKDKRNKERFNSICKEFANCCRTRYSADSCTGLMFDTKVHDEGKCCINRDCKKVSAEDWRRFFMESY